MSEDARSLLNKDQKLISEGIPQPFGKTINAVLKKIRTARSQEIFHYGNQKKSNILDSFDNEKQSIEILLFYIAPFLSK